MPETNETEPKYITLSIDIAAAAEGYRVRMTRTDPESEAKSSPLEGSAKFNLSELRALQLRRKEYGQMLTKQFFRTGNGSDEEKISSDFNMVEKSLGESFLRISLSIDPSASELHGLRWELLRHPLKDEPLCTSQKILFSRFLVSQDWRPVKLRPRPTELTALVAVSAPPSEKMTKFAPVNFDREVGPVRAALEAAGVKTIKTLGGPGEPFTVESLIKKLDESQGGVDILYLVAHGAFSNRSSDADTFNAGAAADNHDSGGESGTSVLVLQNEAGDPWMVRSRDLAMRIDELQKAPRLAVLTSCQSAGDGEQVDVNKRPNTSQATLAGWLADAGVPAVIAMQGFISMETVERMMPVFFKSLLQYGQIDWALAEAREEVRERSDAWMPALYMRLLAGRLWYTSGFKRTKGAEPWQKLKNFIQEHKVVPILGPRLLESVHGTSHDTAQRLARDNDFPFAAHEWDDLPRVTQFMSTMNSRDDVLLDYKKRLIVDTLEQHRVWLEKEGGIPDPNKPAAERIQLLLERVGKHNRSRDDDPYSILAALPVSIYLSTTFDPLLELALTEKNKTPQSIVSLWRSGAKPALAEDQKFSDITPTTPLVYHAFGAFGADDETDSTLVLTEDDYFDYMMNSTAQNLTPKKVEAALTKNALLFLGFRLTDWHFRVLFRLIMNLGGKDNLWRKRHVAVQLDPAMQSLANVVKAKDYVEKYYHDEANIDIYWGDTEDFLKALKQAAC